jgi:hypothetical protein
MYQVFGTLNIVAMIVCYFLPETGNLSLEKMDVIFGVVDEETRKHEIELKLSEKFNEDKL